MTFRLSVILAFGVAGLGMLSSAAGQGPAGPDDKGAVLINPLAPPVMPPASQPTARPLTPPLSPTPTSNVPDYVANMFDKQAAAATSDPNRRILALLEEEPDINKDLAVHPKLGNWMILVISYPGKNGAANARKMCLELREKYRAPAYIFSYGAEERRKEFDRVRKVFDQQQKFLKESGLTTSQPFRMRFEQIEVHHGVLIGGYPDDRAAEAALKTIRTWAQPDETRVDLEKKVFLEMDPKDPDKIKQGIQYYINPFKKAFLCRNPTVKHEVEEPKFDVAFLKKVNTGEPYSLFNCKKPYTLAVKEFQTTHTMQDRATPNNIFDPWAGKSERFDPAALSAHNLCETLRKQLGMSSVYVLHGKYSSTVTVGEFNSADDPSLKATQEQLAAKLSRPELAPIQFFHRPVPMAVPR